MIKLIFYSLLSFFSKIMQHIILIKLVNMNMNTTQILNFYSFQNYFQVLSGIASGGVNSGLIKFISSDTGRQEKYVLSSILISFTFTILVAIYLLFVSFGFFGIHQYGTPAWLIIIFLVFSTIGSLLSAFLIGTFRANYLIVINFLSIAISLVVLKYLFESNSLFLLYFIVGIQSFFLVLFFVMIFFGRINRYIKILLSVKLDRSIIRNLSKFIIHSIMWAIITPLFYILLRNFLTSNFHVDMVLNWEMISKISLMLFVFNSTVVSMYLFPSLSKTDNSEDLYFLLYKALKICFILNILVSLLVILSSDIIMSVVLSYSRPLPLISLSYHLVGDIFRSGSWVLLSLLISKSRIFSFWMFELPYKVIILASLYVATSYSSSNEYYFIYATASFLLFFSLFFYVRKIKYLCNI